MTQQIQYTWAKRGEQGPKGDRSRWWQAKTVGINPRRLCMRRVLWHHGAYYCWNAQVPTLIKDNIQTQTTWLYTDSTGEAGYTVSYNAKDGNTGANGIAGKDGGY